MDYVLMKQVAGGDDVACLLIERELVSEVSDGFEELKGDILERGVPYDVSAMEMFLNSSYFYLLPALNDIMLEEIEDGVRLFNPYHDAIGRFTSAKGARTIVGFVKAASGRRKSQRHKRLARGGARGPVEARFRGADRAIAEVGKQRDFLERNLSGFDGSAKVVLGGRMPPLVAGRYNSLTRTVVVSKKRSKNLGKKFDYGTHALMHEQIHSRRGIKRAGQSKRTREASTELITRRMSHKMYGKYEKRGYSAPTRYLGNYAMRRSGGSRRRAWRYISDVHLGRQRVPDWVWLDKSLSFGSGWEQMVRDPDNYQLEEIQLQEVDDRVMIVYELLDEERWGAAMSLAKVIGDDALIEDVMETAAHDNYFFKTEGAIPEDGGPS